MTDRDPRLQAIRERCEKATKGPWMISVDHDVDGHETGYGRVFAADGGDAIVDYTILEECAFIAHAREDIPYLLDLLTQQAETLAQLQEELDRFQAAEHECIDADDESVCSLRAENGALVSALVQRDTMIAQDYASHARLIAALQWIRDNDPDCQCEHDDENCCAEQSGGFCARCLAAKYLATEPTP